MVALMTPVVSLVDDLFVVGDFEAADLVLTAIRADAAREDAPERQALALMDHPAIAKVSITGSVHDISANPDRLGRLVVSAGHRLSRIVQHKACSSAHDLAAAGSSDTPRTTSVTAAVSINRMARPPVQAQYPRCGPLKG